MSRFQADQTEDIISNLKYVWPASANKEIENSEFWSNMQIFLILLPCVSLTSKEKDTDERRLSAAELVQLQ